MLRLRIAMLSCGFLIASTATGYSQLQRSEVQQMGLESAWQSQVQLPQRGAGLVSSHLWTHAENPRKFAVVELPGRKLQISAEQLDRNGVPIGLAEAKLQAQKQAARILGKSEGIQVVEVTVPRISLVLVTSDGLVQSIDAETGALEWTNSCGPSRAIAFPGAVSPMGITVIHGEKIYLLDWGTGKHLMAKPLRFSSSNSVAVCNDMAFVSDFTGRVECYGLGKTQRPWGTVIQGRAIGRTANLLNQEYSAIASDAGYVYVFSGGEEPRVRMRYETSSPITGSVAAGNGAFYAGSAAGVVSKFAVEGRLGRIFWEFRLGQTVTAAPLVIENNVLVAAEDGSVIAINDSTGLAEWSAEQAHVESPIAKLGNHYYCLSFSGELISMDAETGRIEAISAPMNLSRPVVNQLDDRIYLVSKLGRIQCLRPIGGGSPKLFTAPKLSADGEQKADSTQGDASGADSSGFGGEGENPFGGMLNAPAAGEDPFGGSGSAEDPFGGSGTAKDPFGGGGTAEDPFGGSGSAEDPFGSGGSPF